MEEFIIYTRLFEMVLRGYQMNLEVSKMISGVSEMVSGIYGRFWNNQKVRNIMEGSRRVRDDPGYQRESGRFHNRCNHVALMLRRLPNRAIRIEEGNLVLVALL